MNILWLFRIFYFGFGAICALVPFVGPVLGVWAIAFAAAVDAIHFRVALERIFLTILGVMLVTPLVVEMSVSQLGGLASGLVVISVGTYLYLRPRAA